MLAPIAVISLAVLLAQCDGFSFDLPARSFRCFTEEIPSGVELNITYAALPGYGQLMDVKVTDPHNNIIHEDSLTDKGRFFSAVAPGNGGDYAVCFYSRMVPGLYPTEGMHRVVRLLFSTGQDNVDYDRLASAHHMKPMELHLRVARDTVRELFSSYQYYKEREREMSETSEHMHVKIVVLNVLLMTTFVLFAWWEAQHLTRHFKRKRLLD